MGFLLFPQKISVLSPRVKTQGKTSHGQYLMNHNKKNLQIVNIYNLIEAFYNYVRQ